MGSEWTEYSLADLYSVRSGLSKPAKDFGEGYPFLSFKDVFYNYFLPEELTELVRSNDKEREGCSIKRGDVFLTRTSETMDVMPDKTALQHFDSILTSYFDKTEANNVQSKTLTKLRDTLLPKLISGELRLPAEASAQAGIEDADLSACGLPAEASAQAGHAQAEKMAGDVA